MPVINFGNTSDSLSYPKIAPSLNLNFVNNEVLDPRITFSRNSTGTYYDGVTVAKAEENLVTNSENFAGSGWSGTATVATDVTTAPNGTTTADSITAATTGIYRYVRRSPAGLLANAQFTWSVSAKKNTSDWVTLRFWDIGAGVAAWFNLATGTVGTVQTGCTASISDQGNGWYRCSITRTIGGSLAYNEADFQISSGDNTNDANAGNSVYIWGAQLEQRGSVTAYTPTTSAPITNYVPRLLTAPANTPRFQHDPVTGESLGLLVEEQRTNLLIRSQEFDNAAWAKSNVTVAANTVIAPDGSLTGDKLIANSGSPGNETNATTTVSSGTSYTLSVFVKSDGVANWVQLINTFATGVSPARAWFNLSTGVVGTRNGGYSSSSITPIGNGWYRIAATFTASATASTSYIGAATGDNVNAYAGDDVSGIYVWGAQLEAGDFPTSYIATTGTQTTRNADAVSVTGTNFSSWYNPSEGVGFLECVKFTPTNRFVAGFGYSTTQYIGFLYGSTVNTYIQPGISNFGNYAFNPGDLLKSAVGYQVGNYASVINGVVSTSSSQTPTPSGQDGALYLGASPNGTSSYASCYIRRFVYYPRRLTNAELQILTL